MTTRESAVDYIEGAERTRDNLYSAMYVLVSAGDALNSTRAVYFRDDSQKWITAPLSSADREAKDILDAKRDEVYAEYAAHLTAQEQA